MVGLYPIYDPVNNWTPATRPTGLRLPGRPHEPRRRHASTSTTTSRWRSTTAGSTTASRRTRTSTTPGRVPGRGQPRTHPEWWGKTFYRHFPNHGFVGDIFTVNGTAYPVLEVKRRKYRFRFLDASVSRIYELQADDLDQGPEGGGLARLHRGRSCRASGGSRTAQQCMKLTADRHRRRPAAACRSPRLVRAVAGQAPRGHRRLHQAIMDGSPDQEGRRHLPDQRDEDGDRPDVGQLLPVRARPELQGPGDEDRHRRRRRPDNSVMPGPTTTLRDLPPLPANWPGADWTTVSIFEVQRGSAGGEIEWLINGEAFDPTTELASLKNRPVTSSPLTPKKDSFDLWEIRNGGGGWVHPFHLHMEEHRTVMRNGKDVTVHVRPGPPGRHLPRGPGRARPVRVRDHLPRLPGLRRPVRGALPQPGPRGPRHDVRLDDRALGPSSP